MTAADRLDALAADTSTEVGILRTAGLRLAMSAAELDTGHPLRVQLETTGDDLARAADRNPPDIRLLRFARELLGIPAGAVHWTPPARARVAVLVHEIPEPRSYDE